MCVSATMTFAQSEIQFNILKTSQPDIPQSVVDALDLRLKQILTRNSAASANKYNVFAIEPTFELVDVLSTEGLMEEATIVKGELTLTAKNTIDGTLYYSLVIPVSGTGVGADVARSKEKAMTTMIANIKATDTKYTRFIRITRQKINDYYAANCATILMRAQNLFDQRKYQEAQAYLSAVSDALPCYEQAKVLLKEISEYTGGPDTVIIERVVEKPVVIEKPVIVEKPVAPATPVVNQTPKLNYDISISANDLDVKVVRCFGNEVQQRITIVLEVMNKNNDINNTEVSFNSAFDLDGKEWNHRGGMRDDYNWSYTKLPPMVSRKQEYYVLKVTEKIPGFSYVELKIRGAKVVIRNLAVEW